MESETPLPVAVAHPLISLPVDVPAAAPRELVDELYVFNFDPSLTEVDLRTYFDQFGVIEDLVKKERYAFLQFETAAAVKACLAQGELHTVKNLPPFNVRISQALKSKASDKYVPNQVFLGSLPRGANTKNLRERFEQIGEVREVRVVYHSTTGLPKNAKVTFATMQDFNAALKKEQVSFLGAIVDVKRSLAQPHNVREQRPREYGDQRRKF